MPTVDKKVSGARGYSLILLTVMVAAGVVLASEANRWILLHQARTAVAQWLLHDFVREDFEDWWLSQQVEKRSLADTYRALSGDRLGANYEHYYSGFGAARLDKTPPRYYISIAQPSRDIKGVTTQADIPDLRPDIPDLRPWRMPVESSVTLSKVVQPVSKDDAAILIGVVALNQVFKKNNPEKARQLPKLLQEDWGADKRWLALGAEKDKAALQLIAVSTSAGVEKSADETMPKAYRTLERKLTSAAVKIPVLDVELPSLVALWSLAGLAFLIALLLRVAVADVSSDQTSERQEDWLVLDAKSGLALGLARAWIISAVAAPIIIPAGVVYVAILRWIAADVRLGTVVFESAAALVLGGIGCYISAAILHNAKTVNPSLPWSFRSQNV